MSLRRCPGCGNMVARESVSCPVCGGSYAQLIVARIARWSVVVVSIALFAYLWRHGHMPAAR